MLGSISGCDSSSRAGGGSTSSSAVAQAPRPPEDPQTPEKLTAVERAFLEARLDKTVELLAVRHRDSTDGLLHAYALFLLGDEPRSKQVFSQTMAAPRYLREDLFRAFLSLVTGKLDEAVKHFDRERKQAPERFFASVMHVEVLTLAGRYDDAAAALAPLKTLYPRENIVPHTEGHLESARQAWGAAAAAYERSRELGGENPDIDEGIAAAMIGLHDWPRADDAILRCKKSFPEYAEILYQEVRRSALAPGSSAETLSPLIAKYKSVTKRRDRVEEVERLVKRP